MTLNEAIIRMQEVVTASVALLEGNGFTMSVETDYMNHSLEIVDDQRHAKYVTVSLVISADGIAKGDEYCMSLGAMISRRGIDEEQLERDILGFTNMVNDAVTVLEKYEDKAKGLKHLSDKASAEYEKLLEKIEEEQKKNQKITRIINIALIAGIALLFLIALLR